MTLALIGFAALFALILLRVPIAFAMATVGFFGFASILGFRPTLSMVGTTAFDAGLAYNLSVLPLFILMGNFVARAGLAGEIFHVAHVFLGKRRGGLAMSTIVACGGFSAICGSSIATAATMSQVAIPSMRRYGYSDALASGSIAAGGTLGILIPPSVILVIYGVLTEESVGQLFAAGAIPGLLGILLYLAAVRWTVWRNPAAGPAAEGVTWSARWRALRGVWGVLLLFALVIGGIYLGFFTPTEAAGVGAVGAFLFTLLRGKLTWMILLTVLRESAVTTAMIFAILIGALIFTGFINYSGLPESMLDFIREAGITPLLVILAMMACYLVLGCMLESLSMILLTVPLFYPLVAEMGYSLIWFGILVVVVTEISLITPPVGLNVFVLKTYLPNVPVRTIFSGVLPFVAADVIRLALLVAVPALSLWLPELLFGR